MTLDTLFDPIFLVPFINGLLLSAVLPPLGAYARLRGEWLASLGVAQAAAAGIVLGGLFSSNVTVFALVAAVVAAATKAVIGRTAGDDLYAVMLLAGWAVALLLAANSARGDDISRALLQGQLYFTGVSHLANLAVVAVLAAVLLPWASPGLLRGRFFPDDFLANGVSYPREDAAFDVLVAVTLALAASIIGVMAAFALVFVPPWVAFGLAQGWRRTLTWSLLLGVAAYVVSFALAILFDQPFGPMLVASLIVVSLGRRFRGR